MKTLIRQESIKTKKIYLQEHDFCIQEKTDQLSLSFGQHYLANFLLHIVGMLKMYIFIAYYCYNIGHENKKKVVIQALFKSNQSLLRKVKQLTVLIRKHVLAKPLLIKG